MKLQDAINSGLTHKVDFDRVKESLLTDLIDLDYENERINSIPLDTFFFKDSEGHHFEIQQFLSADAIAQFLSKN